MNSNQFKIELKNYLKRNKEGIVIGAIVGFLLGKFILPNYIDFSMVNQTYGLVDIIKGTTSSAIELAKTKIVWASTILGAIIGMILDNSLPEKWWK